MATSLLSHACVAADAEPAFWVGKGLNLNRPYLNVHKVSKGKYTEIEYDGADAAFQQRLIDLSNEYGVETVRVNASVLPLLQGQPVDTARQLAVLDNFVNKAIASGLKVILSLHTMESTGIWTASKILADADSEEASAYVDMVGFVANDEAGRDPRKFALALFNEPPSCDSHAAEVWSAFQHRIYTVARKDAPRLTLILTGPCFSAIKGVTQVDPSGYDQNTLFDIHFYEPTLFTQQGNNGGVHYTNYVHRLSFPPERNQFGVLNANFDRESSADHVPPETQALFLGWLKHDAQEFQEKGAALVTQPFATLFQWAESKKISPRRLMLGEFGVRRDYQGLVAAAEPDRIRWASLVRNQIESPGGGWVFYALVGPWGLTSEDLSEPADPALIVALTGRKAP